MTRASASAAPPRAAPHAQGQVHVRAGAPADNVRAVRHHQVAVQLVNGRGRKGHLGAAHARRQVVAGVLGALKGRRRVARGHGRRMARAPAVLLPVPAAHLRGEGVLVPGNVGGDGHGARRGAAARTHARPCRVRGDAAAREWDKKSTLFFFRGCPADSRPSSVRSVARRRAALRRCIALPLVLICLAVSVWRRRARRQHIAHLGQGALLPAPCSDRGV